MRVCCSSDRMLALTDNKSHTYWQASNAEKCEHHFILVTLREHIKLASVSIFSIGSKSDDFLKSVVIELRAGFAATSDSIAKNETVIAKNTGFWPF